MTIRLVKHHEDSKRIYSAFTLPLRGAKASSAKGQAGDRDIHIRLQETGAGLLAGAKRLAS